MWVEGTQANGTLSLTVKLYEPVAIENARVTVSSSAALLTARELRLLSSNIVAVLRAVGVVGEGWRAGMSNELVSGVRKAETVVGGWAKFSRFLCQVAF